MAAININREQFDRMISSVKYVLVDFWAPWCTYCRRLGPAYDRIAEEYSETLEVVKVNIDEEPQLVDTEKIEVLPTLVLYRNGKVLGSIVAPESQATITQFICETLEK